MNVSNPFIQSVYCLSVFKSASGSACAEKVAFGVQYSAHPCQPFPVSQASKNCLAIVVKLATSFLPSPTNQLGACRTAYREFLLTATTIFVSYGHYGKRRDPACCLDDPMVTSHCEPETDTPAHTGLPRLRRACVPRIIVGCKMRTSQKLVRAVRRGFVLIRSAPQAGSGKRATANRQRGPEAGGSRPGPLLHGRAHAGAGQ